MPAIKKRRTPRPEKPPVLWSASPLAALSQALVCDCRGGTIVGVNDTGRKILGYVGKASPCGRPFAMHFFAGTEASPKALSHAFMRSLTKGRQPKRMLAADRKGRHIQVEVSAKALGGLGPNAHVLIVAKPVAVAAGKPAVTSAKTKMIAAQSNLTAQILGATSNGIVALDLKGVITFANPAAAELLNRDAAAMRGMAIERAFVHGAGHEKSGKPVPIKAQLKTGPHQVDQEIQLARSDGESFEAVYVVVPVTEGRRVVGYVITFRDVTRRRRSEAALRLAAAVFDHSPEGLIIADAAGRITKTNPAYRRIDGNENADLAGKPLSEVLFSESKTPTSLLDMLQDSDQTQWEQWCKSSAGRRYAARISVSVVRDTAGDVQQYVAIVADITRRKLDEEKIIFQANYDQLTGLPNRTLFMDRLTRLVLEGRRAKTSVGLMFIDLDGFKAINDTLGHDAGDELLISTARRLEKCVREADTVARLGGDEFTVIMPLIDNFDAASFVARRIIKSLTEPYDLGGREGRVSASIGISLLPAQASTASELLHNADVAMYHAKRQGKANFQNYSPEMADTVKLKDREP